MGWAKAGVREAELIGKEDSPKLIEVHPQSKVHRRLANHVRSGTCRYKCRVPRRDARADSQVEPGTSCRAYRYNLNQAPLEAVPKRDPSKTLQDLPRLV